MKKQMTLEELEDRKKELESEIEALNNVIDSSNSAVFDLLANQIKKEMMQNIAEEDWKALKNNQKKIEAYRSTEKIIQNSVDLLEEKTEDLEDVLYQISHHQMPLDIDTNGNEEAEPSETGITYGKLNVMLKTGDIKKKNIKNSDGIYGFYLVRKSEEMPGKYALISNLFDGEKLLQYKKTLNELDNTYHIGNIYDDNDNKTLALDALEIIKGNKNADDFKE